MKKTLISAILLWAITTISLQAQGISSLKVKYLVTFEEEKKRYTAWVVPDYDTPNAHNPDTEEKGATAQFTLKVPQGFILSNLKDIKGVWAKNPTKLGREAVFLKAGLSGDYEYYVIGKAPAETNYGVFTKDEPVALFSFEGTGGIANQVQVLESNDPFVQIANERLSLNVGSSFYSRSGQQPTVSAQPLEQFATIITPSQLLHNIAQKIKANNAALGSTFSVEDNVLTYPNPATDVITVKYFSSIEKEKVKFELADLKGSILTSASINAKLGLNTHQISVIAISNGTYLLRTIVGNKVFINKVVKEF